MLAAGALVASLFAVGAAPAAAAEIDSKSKQDNLSGATACLGSAAADAGFSDIDGLVAEADINCLANYGITTGKTADTFDPNSNVTRSQMALFLYRAAGKMGADLMGGDMMADFGDIADQSEERQNAIKALARNGILEGRSDMAFEPDADITRAEMAVALVTLVDKVSDQVRKSSDTGLFELNNGSGVYGEPTDYFADARTGTPRHVDNAISAAFELGITTGYPDYTFRPNSPVLRKNMASFIVRALNQSGLRPAGVTAQVVKGELRASVRNADFEPVVNQAIDLISISSSIASKAFKADGTCSSRIAAASCTIDVGDAVTLTGGDAVLTMPTIGDAGVTVWVWAGDIGDKFGAETDAFELEIPKTATPLPDPTLLKVSNSLAEGATFAHFGATVTVTVQLQGDADTNDATNPLDDVPPKVKSTITVTTSKHDGTATSTEAYDVKTTVLTFGDDGSVSFELTARDPDPSADNSVLPSTHAAVSGDPAVNTRIVQYTLSAPTPSTITIGSEVVTGAAGTVTFTDATPSATNVSVAPAAKFAEAPAAGNAHNAVVVTVTDQFGRPVARAQVTATGGDDAAFPTTARITGGSGTVRIPYSYDGDAGTQTINVTVTGVTATIDPATVTWYNRAGSADADKNTAAEQTVLHINTAASEIVVTDGTTPRLVSYDSTDYFFDDTVPVSLADFVESLGNSLAAVPNGGTAPTLQWSNYIFDDPSATTSFRLTTA